MPKVVVLTKYGPPAYTYLNPLLEQRAGLTGEQVSVWERLCLAFELASHEATNEGRAPCR
jgi:hypothetical protein